MGGRQPPSRSRRFRLERHRTQWGHLPLVLSPFLVVIAGVLVALALEPTVGEAAATTIISVVGVAFAAFVLALPLLVWPWWRRRGRFELELDGKALSLRGGGRVLGRAAVATAAVRPCNFEYAVYTRFGGGRFRAPALIVQLDGAGEAAIGVTGTQLGWRGEVPTIRRPDYAIDATDWRRLVDAVGLASRAGPFAARC